jgi:hypothetical protein
MELDQISFPWWTVMFGISCDGNVGCAFTVLKA